MQLNEKYKILKTYGLIEVKGKQYKDGFAITYDYEMSTFNITHIDSGTCLLSSGYKKLSDCLENADELIEKAKTFIKNNPKRIDAHVKCYKECIKNNLIEKY